jgi:hypothetical protein
MKRLQLHFIVAATLLVSAAACNKAPSTTSADSISKPAEAPLAASDVVEKAKAEPKAEFLPEPKPEPITIPAGTKLRVNLIDAISSDKNHAGDRFSASLAEPVVIEGRTVLAKGTKVRGHVVEAKGSGRVKGRATIELKLTEILLKDGKGVEISTRTYSAIAPATKKRDAAIIGGGAGLGAVIGALAGGGKGAAIGAAVGGGAGTGTVLATKGKEIRYGAETRLQFTLASPVQI